MSDLIPAKTGLSRVFITEGQARGDRTPEYMGAMRAGALAQSFGDVTPIKIPSSTRYSQYDEVGEIQGAEERPTLTVEGRYAIDIKSKALKLARLRCAFDIQVHFGICTDPREFNEFEKAIIFEGAKISNYSTDDLGSITDDDESDVMESIDLSGTIVYEVLPLNFAEKAGTIVTNEVIDTWIGDTQSCGDCEDQSDGCEKVFALSIAAGGSVGTPGDIIYTLNKWADSYAHDVDSLGVAENPSAGDKVGSYIVVVSNDSGSAHIALYSEFDGTTDPTFTEITTGFVAAAEPNAIKSVGSKAFIVGDAGYVYLMTDPSSGVTVLDAGESVADNLYAVDALSSTFAVAVGGNGAVVFTQNGTTWEETATRPVGVGISLNGVAVKSDTEWWVCTSDGHVYYTINAGNTWNLKDFPGSGAGVCYDIELVTNSVMRLAHTTATPRGRVLESLDGGQSWTVLPRGTSGALKANDRINAIASCKFDPNSLTAVGLADNGTDGIVIYGDVAETV